MTRIHWNRFPDAKQNLFGRPRASLRKINPAVLFVSTVRIYPTNKLNYNDEQILNSSSVIFLSDIIWAK